MVSLASASPNQSSIGLPPRQQPKATPHCPATLLFAEDDDELRCVMECVLTAMGFAVVACANAQLASAAYHSHSHIDALLTDFDMPGRTGIELARELTDVHPLLPVAIVTGSFLTADLTSEIKRREWMHFSKPCTLSSLQTALTQSIARARDAA